MLEAACHTPEKTTPPRPYLTIEEHLAAEMKRLDLLIYRQVLKQRSRRPSGSLHPFKGLVLSEEEIDRILSEMNGPRQEEHPSNSSGLSFPSLPEFLAGMEKEIQGRRADSLAQNIFLPLPSLSHLFGLTPLEEECLIVCLAPELDGKYEKLFAYLQDDITRRRPSIGLVLDLLCPIFQQRMEARAVFDPRASLQKYGLLLVTDGSPDGGPAFPSRSLRLDDRMVNFLLGSPYMDSRLAPFAQLISPRDALERATVSEEAQFRVRNLVRSHFSGKQPPGQPKLVFYFRGPYGAGKRALAEAACHDLGIPLIVADLKKLVDGPLSFGEAAGLLGREAALQPAALCLENFQLSGEEDKNLSLLTSLLEMIRTFCPLTFILGPHEWRPQGLFSQEIFVSLEFPVPEERTRKKIWEKHLEGAVPSGDRGETGALASKFRFTSGQIQDALAAARNLAKWRSPGVTRVTLEDIYQACRDQSQIRLAALARKIEPQFSWNDLVLPGDPLAQLREICNQARYRDVVYGEWGFNRKLSLGKGLNALFSGPPGTGKTMAAEVMANELKLDLYKIDLSTVVSKYIGETEKNLSRIFAEAESSNVILFFDEADALFGKRSEVRDSHDRYANLEISYLLQKMESHEGIAILATNLRGHMDEAFVRRMHFVVEFPFPDEEYRLRIWQGVLPPEVPVADGVDLKFLARHFKLSGGHIRNIALAASFLAAADGQVLTMTHLIRSTKREHQKLGWLYGKAEFGPYYDLIKESG